MKNAFSILMIFVTMLASLTKLGILINFKINQDFIAKELCINKDEPIKMCYGKCHLSKQLKKAEEREEKQAPTNKKEKLEITYYYVKIFFGFFEFSNSHPNKHSFAYRNEIYKFLFVADISQPPKLSFI